MQAALTIGLTGAPLLYYVILTRADLAWHLARESSKHSFPLGSILIAIAPLMLPALLAYRKRPADVPRGDHARLADRRLRRVLPVGNRRGRDAAARLPGDHVPAGGAGDRRPADDRLGTVGAVAAGSSWPVLAVATIPATGYELYNAAKLAAPTDGNGNFITADERDALKYLAKSPEPGGVITQGYLGALVPGHHRAAAPCWATACGQSPTARGAGSSPASCSEGS